VKRQRAFISLEVFMGRSPSDCNSSAVSVKLSNCSLEKLVSAALEVGKRASWL